MRRQPGMSPTHTGGRAERWSRPFHLSRSSTCRVAFSTKTHVREATPTVPTAPRGRTIKHSPYTESQPVGIQSLDSLIAPRHAIRRSARLERTRVRTNNTLRINGSGPAVVSLAVDSAGPDPWVRRRRDSNPRNLAVLRFSKPVHSAALPPLLGCSLRRERDDHRWRRTGPRQEVLRNVQACRTTRHRRMSRA